MKLIGIVGGIGSGKSVVSHILTLLGYEVYDCDFNAKLLMNTSTELQNELTKAFGKGVINERGEVDRPVLSSIIFNDADALTKVNSIVHPLVIADILTKAKNSSADIFFFETALPHESGLDKVADEIWLVDAPEELRIERVMARNNMDRSQVKIRVNSQNLSIIDNENIKKVNNDGICALLPQISKLIIKY